MLYWYPDPLGRETYTKFLEKLKGNSQTSLGIVHRVGAIFPGAVQSGKTKRISPYEGQRKEYIGGGGGDGWGIKGHE